MITDGVDNGHVRRPLPVEKALDGALLAYEMNGRELPPDHGFPLRLVVPGWIGVASVKWLGSLEVSDRPLTSPWNTRWYRMTGPDHPPDSPPLTAQPVKSAFELAWDAELPAGRRTVLHGRSWSGRAPVRRVEVSADGGASWRRAHLREHDERRRGHERRDRSWVRWELPFEPRRAGAYVVRARATDANGLTQPAAVPFNDGGYQFWATVAHPVHAVPAR